MRTLTVLAASFAMLLSLGTLSARADGQSVEAEIRKLKAQIQRLEERQQKTNMKVSDSKAGRSVKVKTKKGTGLTFQTADGNYKLRTRIRGQFLGQYDKTHGGDDNLGFRVKRLRIVWDGNAFAPWMKYKFQYEFSKGGELKDLKLSFAKNRMFVPVVGQYKVPFNREVLNSSSALQLVDRSILSDHFKYDRDIGVGAYGLLGDGTVRYELGAFQADGVNKSVDGDDKGVIWAGRIQAAVIGGKAKKVKENFARKPALTVGAAVAGIDVEAGSDSNLGRVNRVGRGSEFADGKITSITADVNYRDPRFNLTGEYIGRWANPDAAGMKTAFDYGFRAQGGFFLMPKKVELAGRYVMVKFDDVTGDLAPELDNVWTYTQGLNYYFSGDHRWKLQLDYTYQREKPMAGTKTNESMVRAQVQAYF